MCDSGEELSPLPFRRERNLSNRNFNKRNSRRRFSNESRTSSMRRTLSNSSNTSHTSNGSTGDSEVQQAQQPADRSSSGVSSNAIALNFSCESVEASNGCLLSLHIPKNSAVDSQEVQTPTSTPDPALYDVKHKVQHFETLRKLKRIFRSERLSVQQLLLGTPTPTLAPTVTTTSTTSIGDNEMSAALAQQEKDADDATSSELTALVADMAVEASEVSEAEASNVTHAMAEILEKIEGLKQSVSVDEQEDVTKDNADNAVDLAPDVAKKERIYQTFPRNYRAAARPKTELHVNATEKNISIDEKYKSLYQPNDIDEDDEIELRDKSDKCVLPILEELIRTEEAYVDNLFKGIENYSGMFRRKDLPVGLRGKKYDLLGNIEQIAEFHRDEFLPMLQRNKRDLKCLFQEFFNFIEADCFYSYVIFTMNKQTSLKICEIYKNYFKLMQNELDDRLGINSFLVQPIQRMARYPLLLTQFITTFFKNRNIVMKPLIESCCRLERRFRSLLNTTNESEIVNDIVDCNEFNVFYQGKFLKVSEFQVFDHTQRRQYRSKVFIFDKCIIYTEIKGRQLIFHGRYPCEHIGISSKPKCFTLYYERRRQQECDFSGDATLVATWLELIREMVNNFVQDERRKLQERYAHESDYSPRKTPSLSLYRDSNRFSSDSGIGNIWVMPKSEEETPANYRTTWYADT